MGRQGHPVQNRMQEIAKNLPASLSSSSSSVQSMLSAFVPCDSIVHCISMQIVRIVADNRINANIIFNSIFDGFVFPIIRVFIDSSLPPIRSLALGLFFSLEIFFFFFQYSALLDWSRLFALFRSMSAYMYRLYHMHHSLLMHSLGWIVLGAICIFFLLKPQYFQSLFRYGIHLFVPIRRYSRVLAFTFPYLHTCSIYLTGW